MGLPLLTLRLSLKVRTSDANLKVLASSGHFVGLDEVDPSTGKARAATYFSQLDKDRDGLVTFSEFLTPYVSSLAPAQVKGLL